ncbi:2,4-dihydroxyhept-2-ene-1,7-dioic acid aldolase [Halarchaeum rubridurum]|uniref:2,4-dihydroxyhept-2-ene-1,7-dioic acid aldolase n=1 Tax=Halarchaeum rubridurum TaxID=489911 RepID=A0A830FYN8_9EURY|nr:2,4-dihydroxyhept-2-ene-1,7-dioic acid aldolase [Halarchaeum rubridurum]
MPARTLLLAPHFATGVDPRHNALRRTLARDEPAFGVLDNTYSPAAVEVVGELGFDFVWIDLEHGGPSPWDADALADLLRAAELTDTELLVRIPEANPSMVRKALDAGVRNVFLSRVESAAEVRDALAAANFEYDGSPGRRGLAGPRSARYGLADDYVGTEDEEICLGVTVETVEAVENIDEILSVPELGFAFLGPNDFSVAYGSPGDVGDPEVQAAVETVHDAALARDVTLGGLTFGMDDVVEKVERDYQLLHVGSTLGALTKTFGDWHGRYDDAR